MPITKLLYSFIENGPLTGSLFGTASYALDSVYSASLASRSNILESASSSFSTRVTNLVTDSGSFSSRAAALEIASGSFSTRITNLVSDSGSFSTRTETLEIASSSFSTRVTNLVSDSGSFSTRITNLVTDSSSLSTRTATLETASGSFSTRVTNLVSDSSSFSARLSSYTGSIFGTASYATKAETLVSGININAGLITASAISVTTLNVVTITSSIEYASGSNIFGTKSTDTQKFTGSVSITGSLTVNGTVTATSSYSSLAATASYFAGVTNGTTNYVAKFTSANVLGTSSIFESGSSVGIGVTPSAWGADRKVIQLGSGGSINGAASLAPFVEIGANFYLDTTDKYLTTGVATKYRQVNGTHNWQIAASGTAGNTVTFTQAMTLDASGSLALGRTSATAYGTTTFSIDGTGGGYIDTYYNGTRKGYMYAASAAFTLATVTTTPLTFETNGSERMRIDSSGNVGVGMASGGTKLDVNGNGRFMQNAAATTGAIILRQAASDAEGAFIQWVNNANSAEKGWLTVDTSSNMKFATVSTERMRIDSSGNVGIGVTPTQRLDVATTSGDCIIRLGNGTSTARFAVDNDGPYIYALTSGDNALRVFTPAGGTAMTVDSAGAIVVSSTIGTTSSRPAVGTSRIAGEIAGAYTSFGSDGGFLRLSAGGGTGAGTKSYIDLSGYSTDAALETQIQLGTAGVPRMTINVSGNVGIGTTTPLDKLEINGNDKAIALTVGGGGQDYGGRWRVYDTGAGVYTSFDTKNVGSWTNNRFTILSSNGNVGINTTSPSAKLHVFNSTAVSAQAVTSGTNLIIESATSSYLEFRNTSDNGTNQGILFVDNNLGGYVGFTNAATDQMFIGGYAAINLQVGTSNSFGGKTTIAAITSAGAAITGAITATGNITAYFSDDRLKTKLGKIENALDKICSLEGFYYEANDLAQSLGYKAVREVGISAQSVQSVLPEIVAPAPIDSKYLTIHYERTVPLIIEAIKELRNEIAALKK